MTAEANAAVEGAFAGGATRVWVNDSHGGFRNLLPDGIDARARASCSASRARSE
ncbi:D-aminopeptidase family protein [Burkholderia pseudomallei]|nr:D-aminopeptidase family protein [Burkholderia pseudomallei]